MFENRWFFSVMSGCESLKNIQNNREQDKARDQKFTNCGRCHILIALCDLSALF